MSTLSRANKRLLGACAIAVPLSFWAGHELRERFLTREVERIANEPEALKTARTARIIELQQERSRLLEEGENLDIKISDLRNRMASS